MNLIIFRSNHPSLKMVNMPKGRNTYCARCNAHKKFKVTQYKKSAESKQAQGRRRYAVEHLVTCHRSSCLTCHEVP